MGGMAPAVGSGKRSGWGLGLIVGVGAALAFVVLLAGTMFVAGFLVATRMSVTGPGQVATHVPTRGPVQGPIMQTVGSTGGGLVSPFCDDFCWVDANGDQTPDLAMWSGGWSSAHPVVIDGATGRGLWAAPSVPHLADSFMHCTDPNTVIVSHRDFSVFAYEANGGKQRWSVKLSDQALRSAPGPGCLLLETADEKQTGLSLANGVSVNCPPARKPGNFRERGPARADQPLAIGGLQIALTARSTGTPMLTLTARTPRTPGFFPPDRGGAVAWQTDLGIYVNIPYAMAGRIAAAGGVIVVGGRVLSSDIRVRLQGVEAATGRMLWARDFGAGAGIAFVESRNERLYVGVEQAVRLIDPRTGADLWKAQEP